MNRYFLLNKPYAMLSQFIGGESRMLGELDYELKLLERILAEAAITPPFIQIALRAKASQ